MVAGEAIMIKVLLVDFDLKLLNKVISKKDLEVSVLITVDDNRNSEILKNDRINKVYFDKDFYTNDDFEYFDYKDLENFYYAQLKNENQYIRKFVDYQLSKLYYYRGYALVKRIFLDNKIDFIIIGNLNHGHVFDTLIVEMAKFLNIQSYNIEDMLAYKSIIYDNLNKNLVKVNNNSTSYDKSMFYNVSYDDISYLCKDKNKVRNFIREIFYNLGGWLGVELLSCIRHRNLQTDFFKINYIDRLCHYIKLKRLKKYLNKISVNSNLTENYIFFALHFEPEATLSGRTRMDSQLVAIKMIANALPPNWILYVKEHPHQFKVNTVTFSPFIYSAINFKTKAFYDEIHKIKNVRLIKINEKSDQLIKFSKAVATMSGTVGLEAAKFNKPVLLFAAERTVYNKCKGFYKIDSFKCCKNAITEIVSGKGQDYSDFDSIFVNYLIDNNENGYEMAIDSITKDYKEKIRNK